jgi:hypothetical protein
MKRRACGLGVVCCALFLAASAAGGQAPTPVSSHESAARELVRLSGGAGLAEAGAEAMMGTIRQNPELAPYEDVFRAWYRKVFAAGDLESELAGLYVGVFSEGELRELIAFYKTPVGAKTLTVLPALMQQGAEIGLRRAQAHAPELAEMLEKAKAERDPQGTDQAAQKRTVADIRNIGTAMFSWLTDQVSAAAAGQSEAAKVVRLPGYPRISSAELEKLLVPDYLQSLPKTDGWGHPYEYSLNAADPLAREVMAIRSPGRDGTFAATEYAVSAFAPDDFDQDIVWVDGFFVRWPQAPEK